MGDSIRFEISPSVSNFWDDLEEIKVLGLETFQLYHLELSLKHKTSFRSIAYYFSDENGTITLSKDAPVFGMYTGVDTMGLFSSLYTHPAEKITAKLNLSPLPDELRYTLTVFFHDTKRKVGEVEIIRRILHPNLTRIELSHPLLEGVLFVPKTTKDTKIPCIIDMYGVAMGTRQHRAAMMAAQGYCVLALAIFGIGKLSKKHEDVTSEYLQAAVSFITSLPYSDGTCAIVGTSFGGTLAYHTMFKMKEVSCAVSINGQRGHYMVSQLNENGEKLPWTPVLPHNMPLVKFQKGFVSYSEMYGSCELDEGHMLRFEDLKDHQKILYISGSEDRAIDGTVQGREIKKIMESLGRQRQFELIELIGCGHIIDPPFMPVNDFLYQGGRFMSFGGDPYEHGQGQRKGWKELIGFLNRNIGQPVPMGDKTSKL